MSVGHAETKVTSLFDVFRHRALVTGNNLAAVDGITASGDAEDSGAPSLPTRLTYAELYEAAERLAGALAAKLPAGAGCPRQVIGTWMRRGNAWYCTFLASARLQLPVAALSTDLPNRQDEDDRNAEILVSQRPSLLVVDHNRAMGQARSGGPKAITAMNLMQNSVRFSELWTLACHPSLQRVPDRTASLQADLCYCYTGGTTKASRCVRVTHEMALHEVEGYPQVANLVSTDKVLQQHSLYWAASAYGELDVALAFSCAVVFCEAWDTEGLAEAIRQHGASCAGIVPSLLAALRPDDVPTLRLVFTWGEALQPAVARDWAKRVHLLDLLISTECWLSLVADWTHQGTANAGVPPFRVLPNVQTRLRPLAENSQGPPRSDAVTGELLVSGRMVSPGYTEVTLNAGVFEVDTEGRRWYCTKDCLTQGAGGLVFSGRADDLVKVGGSWVDIQSVESRLSSVNGVSEACISGQAAFVALRMLRGGLMAELRSILPPGFALLVVPRLPRRVGTGKVDRRLLQEQLSQGSGDMQEAKELQGCSEEFASLLRWYWPLLPPFVATVTRIICIPLLFDRATLDGTSANWSSAVAWASGHCSLTEPGTSAVPLVVRVGLASVWDLLWRITALVYLLLLIWTLPSAWITWCSHLPLGAYGFVILLCSLIPSTSLCMAVSVPGALVAMRRGRLLAWPLVCLVGFPMWVRHAGWWMRGKSPLGVLGWYLQRLRWICESATHEGFWRTRRFFRLARQCDWCGARVLSSAGHMELAVCSKWYCNACWTQYHKYEQCSKCADWSATGLRNANGEFTCQACQPILLDSGALGSAEPTGRRGRWSGRSGGNVSKRSLTLETTPAVRPLEEGDPMDASMQRHTPHSLESPTKRQRLEDGASPSWNAEGQAPAAGVLVKSREWRTIEDATGVLFDSLSSPLWSLDSLRRTKMASALRRECARRVHRELLKHTGTLGDLLGEIEQLPEEGTSPEQDDRGCSPGADAISSPRFCSCLSRRADSERAVWGMMWNSKCQWLVRRSRPLSEGVLRAALELLIERHEPLRTELRDPYRLFNATQQALSALELWRNDSSVCSASNRGVRVLAAATRWSFRHAWPRVGPRPGSRGHAYVPLTVLERCPTEEEAERKVWQRLSDFCPPFQARLVAFGSGDNEGALVHIAVTHMLSDGFSVVPLLDDLARLVAKVEAEGAVVSALPSLPSPLALLELRLLNTISGVEGGLRTGITRDAVAGKRWREAACVFATLPADAVAAVRRAASCLAIPDDLVMLASIGVALAWLDQQDRAPLAMIVPQRDGPGENDVVGLFADVRHLTVCTKNLSFAGVALQLQYIVKERLWCAPGLVTQYDLALVNFEWTDFAERNGFVQRVHLAERAESSLHPLRIAVDQPDCEAWRLRVAFDKQRFSVGRRERFFEFLESAMQGLLARPLDLVWPDGVL